MIPELLDFCPPYIMVGCERSYVHPADASEFEWDEGNESELARHRVRTEEVEEVFNNHPDWRPNKRNRSGDWRMTGQTNGGRRLVVIVRQVAFGHVLRAITGWDA